MPIAPHIKNSEDVLHGDVKVTPVTIPARTRMELPGTTTSGQLYRRKTVLIQHVGGPGGDLYLGGHNVGFGSGFGGGSSTTCSGLVTISGSVFHADVGRARVYGFNAHASSDIYVKVLEIS